MVERPAPVALALSRMSHPKSWKTDPQDLDVIRPFSAGTLESQLKVPAAGRYGLWLGGSFKSGLQVSIDGKRAGAGRNQLSHPGPLTPLGEAELSRGPHRISIHYDGADLHPGSGGPPYRMGPLVLGQTTADLVNDGKNTENVALCAERPSTGWRRSGGHGASPTQPAR